MNDWLVPSIKKTFAAKTTEELQAILRGRNRELYSDEAFEAVRLILTDRGIAMPKDERSGSSSQEPERSNAAWLLLPAISLCVAAFGAAHDRDFFRWPDPALVTIPACLIIGAIPSGLLKLWASRLSSIVKILLTVPLVVILAAVAFILFLGLALHGPS